MALDDHAIDHRGVTGSRLDRNPQVPFIMVDGGHLDILYIEIMVLEVLDPILAAAATLTAVNGDLMPVLGDPLFPERVGRLCIERN